MGHFRAFWGVDTSQPQGHAFAAASHSSPRGIYGPQGPGPVSPPRAVCVPSGTVPLVPNQAGGSGGFGRARAALPRARHSLHPRAGTPSSPSPPPRERASLLHPKTRQIPQDPATGVWTLPLCHGWPHPPPPPPRPHPTFQLYFLTAGGGGASPQNPQHPTESQDMPQPRSSQRLFGAPRPRLAQWGWVPRPRSEDSLEGGRHFGGHWQVPAKPLVQDPSQGEPAHPSTCGAGVRIWPSLPLGGLHEATGAKPALGRGCPLPEVGGGAAQLRVVWRCPCGRPCPKYPLGCQGESRGRRLPRCPGSLPSEPAGKVGLCPIPLPPAIDAAGWAPPVISSSPAALPHLPGSRQGWGML